MFQAHALHALWILAAIVAYRTLITHRICRSDSSKLALALAAVLFALAGATDWLGVLPDYPRWFLPGVYPIFDWGILALIALGSFFFIRAIELGRDDASEGDHTSAAVEEGSIEFSATQSPHLLAGEEMRRALAQPYPFVELSAYALDRILLAADSLTAGAIYVFNETTGAMTLVSANGLDTDEESALEQIRMREPLLSEAFATGSPTLTRNFFQQCSPESAVRPCALAIPILLADKPLGCVIALSREPIQLSAERKRLLSSLAEIVSEKFHLVKLRGELRRAQRKAESVQSSSESWLSLVATIATEEWTEHSLRDDCARICNQSGSDNCALLSICDDNAEVEILIAESARNESDVAIEPAVMSACRQALSSGIAALLTRRLGSEQRNIGVIAPFASTQGSQRRHALLLWNDEREFSISGSEWRGIQAVVGALTLLSATGESSAHADPGRLLEGVYSLLAGSSEERTSSEELGCLLKVLKKTVEDLCAALLFAKDDRGRLRPVSAVGVSVDELSEVVILPGEGALGRAAAIGAESLTLGAELLDAACLEYDMMNRDLFGDRFAALGSPDAEIILPIAINSRNDYVIAAYLREPVDLERIASELRVLCLIESLKLSALELKAEIFAPAVDLQDPDTSRRLGMAYNSVNNDLSAIVGNCQLVGADPNLPGEVERALRIIQERAESAAERLRAESVVTLAESARLSGKSTESETPASAGVSLTDAIRVFTDGALVGGDILLTDNKARELSLDFPDEVRLNLSESSASQLAEELCRRFTALADERERVTLSTYRTASYQCLDLSRHRREFPALTGAVEFARYQSPVDQFFGLPASLCESLRSAEVEFAVDESDEIPAFLSLRAPIAPGGEVNGESSAAESKSLRILAIDDQSMILDLLKAMCQSMGYEVVVSSSPMKALEEFQKKRFEVVISDIAMPEMSGWDVAGRIRELDAETHIIFITGWGEGIRPEELTDAGVDQIIYKPFRIEQLAEALELARSESLSS